MEKIDKKQSLNPVIGGDHDDSVDWEDFIIISEEITTSFNERKLKTQFYLSRRGGGALEKIEFDQDVNIDYEKACLIASQAGDPYANKTKNSLDLSDRPNRNLSKSNNNLQGILDQQQPQKKLLWSWKDQKQKQNSMRGKSMLLSSNQKEAAEEEAKDYERFQAEQRFEREQMMQQQQYSQQPNGPANLSDSKIDSLNITHQNNNNIYMEEEIQNQKISPLEEVPEDKFITPEDDGEDEQIWSKSKLMTPYSFMNLKVLQQNLQPEAPPPTYESYEQIKLSTEKSQASNNNTNQTQNVEKQKGIVKDVLSKAAANVFSGQSIIGISLPVRIFEPRSLLERICDWYGFAPVFLKQAGLIEDKIERFKLTMAFALSCLYCSLKQQKPFNPLLGETFQAYFEDGTRIFCEHTSHHPPIANFLMQDPEQLYEFWGFYEFKAKIANNNLIMRNEGPNNIKFQDGQTITYCYPTNKLGGMLWGERTLNIDGNMIFEDKENGLKAVIIFKHQKNDGYIGKFYHYKPELNLQKKEPTKLSEIKDIQKEICEIQGSWLESLTIDHKEYWNMKTMEPMKPIPLPNPLQSDPRFREDLLWLKRKNEGYAQTWKTRLEIQQRYERKLRQDIQKLKEKQEKANDRSSVKKKSFFS